MARNVRHRPSTPPIAKKPVNKPVSDNSSDDDYTGVDLISDAEEDEPDVEVAEEQAIIESEEGDNDAVLQPEDDDDRTGWVGFEVDDEHPFSGDGPFFDEEMSRTTPRDMYTEATVWNTTSGRRVRFDLSDSDSCESEDNIFPDIFLDQNSLDPTFRQTIENDRNNDNDDPPSDVESYWDFRGCDESGAVDANAEGDEESESAVGSSSGYETDEGETTEEDLPPAAKYVPARSVLRRQSTESSASEEDTTVIRRNSYRPALRSGPKLGSWVTDASKPFAVMDSRGKKMMMFRARINRRYSFDGSASQPVQGFIEDRDNKTAIVIPPIIRQAANLMVSAMYTPLDSLLSGHALGPPEAFYPFVSIAANGTVTRDSPSLSFEDDDMDDDDLDNYDMDDDEMWNIGDLIDFGDDTSDDEGPGEEEEESSTSPIDISSMPVRPTTANSEDQVHPLLSHLDRGLVGAFRQNQSRHRLLTRNVASRESLAFSGPYHQGTLRGIKGGRLAATNASITPLRKIKAVKVDVTLSPSSPMDAIATGKRKFSGEQHGHKRSRSMV